MHILSSFTHPNVGLNVYDFILWNTKVYFAHTLKVNCVQFVVLHPIDFYCMDKTAESFFYCVLYMKQKVMKITWGVRLHNLGGKILFKGKKKNEELFFLNTISDCGLIFFFYILKF